MRDPITWSPDPEVESDRDSPTNMPKLNLAPETLAAALQGLEAQKARLDAHIAEVKRMPRGRPQNPEAPAEAPKPKRRMSAAATRKRWAENHRQKAEAAKGPAKAVKKTAKQITAKGKKKAATQPVAEGASEQALSKTQPRARIGDLARMGPVA